MGEAEAVRDAKQLAEIEIKVNALQSAFQHGSGMVVRMAIVEEKVKGVEARFDKLDHKIDERFTAVEATLATLVAKSNVSKGYTAAMVGVAAAAPIVMNWAVSLIGKN